MKKISQSIYGLAVILLGFVLLSGCSSTESRRSTGRYVDDQSINARVKTALFQDEDVSGFEISTTTFEGVVQLSGFVDQEFQKMHAADVAREVSGVRSVINNISVKPDATQFGGRDAAPRSESADEPASKSPSTQLERDRDDAMNR